MVREIAASSLQLTLENFFIRGNPRDVEILLSRCTFSILSKLELSFQIGEGKSLVFEGGDIFGIPGISLPSICQENIQPDNQLKRGECKFGKLFYTKYMQLFYMKLGILDLPKFRKNKRKDIKMSNYANSLSIFSSLAQLFTVNSRFSSPPSFTIDKRLLQMVNITSNREYFFQSDKSIQQEQELKLKRTNKNGDPISLSTKIISSHLVIEQDSLFCGLSNGSIQLVELGGWRKGKNLSVSNSPISSLTYCNKESLLILWLLG